MAVRFVRAMLMVCKDWCAVEESSDLCRHEVVVERIFERGCCEGREIEAKGKHAAYLWHTSNTRTQVRSSETLVAPFGAAKRRYTSNIMYMENAVNWSL